MRKILVALLCLIGFGIMATASPSGAAPANHAPIGHFDKVTAAKLHVRVIGWTIDRDTPTTPVKVAIYLGGTYGHAFSAVTALANRQRLDVAAAFPGTGKDHGFSVNIAARRGTFPVCVYAIDTQAPGVSTFLGCRKITVK